MTSAAQTVTAFYDAFGRGDVPSALALFSPGIEWTEAKGSPYYAGTWRGVDAIVAGLFQRIAADFDDFAAAPVEFIAEGDRVAAIGTYTGRSKATGAALEAAFVHVWTAREGVLVSFVQHTDTVQWAEALQS